MKIIYLFLSLFILFSSCKKTDATIKQEVTTSDLDLNKNDEKQILNQVTTIILQHFENKSSKVEVWDHVKVNENIHLFAYNRADADVTYKGIAYFKDNTLLYCNDNAFFCEGCNNAKNQIAEIIPGEDNSLFLKISIQWGLSTGGVYSEYYFWYNKDLDDFVLSYVFENGWENPIVTENGEEKLTSYSNSYKSNFSKIIKLADFNAEYLGEDGTYTNLTYQFNSSAPLNKIEKEIQTQLTNKVGENFAFIFTNDDVQALIETYPMNNKNIDSFKNIANYLAEMGLSEESQALLKQIP